MRALTISEEKKDQIIQIANSMSEKQKRQFLASEAKLLGYGGITLLSKITGVSRITIMHGMSELESGDFFDSEGRQRAVGGGRTNRISQNEEVRRAIEEIVGRSTYGSPTSALLWTTLSLRKISHILEENYFLKVSYGTVKNLLKNMGYSCQTNKKVEATEKMRKFKGFEFPRAHFEHSRKLDSE